jgi:hypothetical protein
MALATKRWEKSTSKAWPLAGLCLAANCPHRNEITSTRFGSPFWAKTEEAPMSKKAAEHHRKASEHSTQAANHHTEAAKHHDAGQHEKAAHHAHTAGTKHGDRRRKQASTPKSFNYSFAIPPRWGTTRSLTQRPSPSHSRPWSPRVACRSGATFLRNRHPALW